MNKDLVKAQELFLDKINQICSKFGLNNIMAQIYALLYLSNKPLSLDDMVERLRISKGSASINIRALERYNAVRKIWVKGSRKDFYEAETDIMKVMMERIRSMAQNRLSEVDAMIRLSSTGLDSVNSQDKEEKEAIKIFKERLARLRSLHDQATSAFNLFNSGIFTTLLANKNSDHKKDTVYAAHPSNASV